MMRYFDDEHEHGDGTSGVDVNSHMSYAILLGAEGTPGRPTTLPADGAIRWPLLAPPEEASDYDTDEELVAESQAAWESAVKQSMHPTAEPPEVS